MGTLQEYWNSKILITGSWAQDKSYVDFTRKEHVDFVVFIQLQDESSDIFDVNELGGPKIISNNKSVAKVVIEHLGICDIPAIVNVSSEGKTLNVNYLELELAIESGNETIKRLVAEGLSFYSDGNLVEAATRFFTVIKQYDENNKDCLFNLACIFHMCEYPTLAIKLTEHILRQDPHDMIVHSFMWALARTDGCHDMAVSAYGRLAQADVKASHKLAALTGRGQLSERGDPEYARHIYDDMAATFETKLVDRLGYRGPWILKDLIDTFLESQGKLQPPVTPATSTSSDEKYSNTVFSSEFLCDWRILDLGCGSGLCGRVFNNLAVSTFPDKGQSVSTKHTTATTETPADDLIGVDTTTSDSLNPNEADYYLKLARYILSRKRGFLIGIDISSNMVDLAKKNGGYTACFQGDVCTLTAAMSDEFKLHNSIHSLTQDSTESCQSSPPVPLHLVIAADTFIYIGALSSVFHHIRNILCKDGLFAFTTEALETSPMRIREPLPSPLDIVSSAANGSVTEGNNDIRESNVEEPVDAIPGWGAQLLESARFAHSKAYIEVLCVKHRFDLVMYREIVLRTEESVPLPGHAFILKCN